MFCGTLPNLPSANALWRMLKTVENRSRIFIGGGGGGGGSTKDIECAHSARNERKPLWPGSRPSRADLGALESLGFRCSLKLSEPYFEAFWWKKIVNPIFFWGGGGVAVPVALMPGSATIFQTCAILFEEGILLLLNSNCYPFYTG